MVAKVEDGNWVEASWKRERVVEELSVESRFVPDFEGAFS